jgi:hypothetical protein
MSSLRQAGTHDVAGNAHQHSLSGVGQVQQPGRLGWLISAVTGWPI